MRSHRVEARLDITVRSFWFSLADEFDAPDHSDIVKSYRPIDTY
jgi:hypothetical protein